MVHIKSRPILDVLFNSKKEIMRKLGRDLVANNCVINTLHKDKTIQDTWEIDSFEVVPKESYFDKYNKGMYGRLFEKETLPKEDNTDGYGFHYTTNKGVGYDVPIHLKLFTKEQNGISHIFDVYCEFKNSKFYLKLIHQYVIDGDISIGTMEDGRKTYTKLIDDPIAKIYGLNDARNIVVTCSPKDYNANQHANANQRANANANTNANANANANANENQHANQHVSQHVNANANANANQRANQHVSQHVNANANANLRANQHVSQHANQHVSQHANANANQHANAKKQKHQSRSRHQPKSKSASSKSASSKSPSFSPSLLKSHKNTKSNKKKLKWKNKTHKQKLDAFK